jgi:hypothetical protein
MQQSAGAVRDQASVGIGNPRLAIVALLAAILAYPAFLVLFYGAGRFAVHLAKAASVDQALASYESDRREATARIVLMNRQQGPDRVLDLARDRLAAGGALADVLPMDERRAIARSYKQTAGFDPAVLNERASLSPGR